MIPNDGFHNLESNLWTLWRNDGEYIDQFYWPDFRNDVLWGGLQNQIISYASHASTSLITRTSNMGDGEVPRINMICYLFWLQNIFL